MQLRTYTSVIMRSFWVFGFALLMACNSGSSDQDASADSMTQRQRDSTIGASNLPGAQGLARAQRITDSLNARPAAPDSLDRDP